MIEPTTPVSITLQQQEWNNVLVALMDAPYRIAAPLVQKIGQQAREAEAAALPAGPQP
jgi:hypothetical protein